LLSPRQRQRVRLGLQRGLAGVLLRLSLRIPRRLHPVQRRNGHRRQTTQPSTTRQERATKGSDTAAQDRAERQPTPPPPQPPQRGPTPPRGLNIDPRRLPIQLVDLSLELSQLRGRLSGVRADSDVMMAAQLDQLGLELVDLLPRET